VLLTGNDWWAQAWNPAPDIQKMQADTWIRLMGVPTIWASNWHISRSDDTISDQDNRLYPPTIKKTARYASQPWQKGTISAIMSAKIPRDKS